ncbi:VanW family protein [Neoactinobaculum massilliense]|uniref:VanW family protein n=1 Tax=Neoactinobaculum massilliense TaxID=2364794 RepID=UPI000F540A38|nr:VanW family protein [Neoactinobaculum massilliense]
MAKSKRRRWPWITAGIIILLAGGYVWLANWTTARVPSGTSVAGVEIGGLTEQKAAERLNEKLPALAARTVNVSINGGTAQQVDPATYKLAADAQGTLNGLTGFTLNPARVWNSLFGTSTDITPAITYDAEALDGEIARVGTVAGKEPTNASITFNGTTAEVQPGAAGIGVDRDQARTALTTGVFTSDTIELKATQRDPEVTDAEAQSVKEQVADPLVAANVDVKVGDKTASLTPAQLAAAASFPDSEGNLKLNLDGDKLLADLKAALPDALTGAQDARIEIKDHTTPTVIPSKDGQTVDATQLAQDVAKAASTTVARDRTVSAKVTTQKATFTTDDANKMGVKEVVSEISTPLTADNVRTKNLVVGTAKVANTLVKPGEQFSLLTALGPITAENGFVSSGVVSDGFNDVAMGGGLSQLSTNTFNVGYLAGMVDVSHKPHSKHFSRYPMGREATLWEGSIDMIWKNRTPYGAVIDAYVENGQVVTKLWSTKYFDVDTSTSAPRNYVQATTVTGTGATCKPQSAGGPGFTVTVRRTVKLNGKVVEDSSYDWTYQPVNGRVCQ